MSDTQPPQSTPTPTPSAEPHPTGAPPVGAVLDGPTVQHPETPSVESESTVGTGTSIALGCIAGTIVLIIFGLIFLGIVALLD
jgi:hypothetical protein